MILRLVDKQRHYLPASEIDKPYSTKRQATHDALEILQNRSDISRVELWETDSITDPTKRVATWGQRDIDTEALRIKSLLKELRLTQPELADLMQTSSKSIMQCKKGGECPKWIPIMITFIWYVVDNHGPEAARDLLFQGNALLEQIKAS